MSTLITPGRRLSQHASSMPDKPAAIVGRAAGGTEQLTYAALEARANQLARHLADEHAVAQGRSS